MTTAMLGAGTESILCENSPHLTLPHMGTSGLEGARNSEFSTQMPGHFRLIVNCFTLNICGERSPVFTASQACA